MTEIIELLLVGMKPMKIWLELFSLQRTVYLHSLWPSSFLFFWPVHFDPLDRWVFSFRAVHVMISGPSTFADRPLLVFWTVEFDWWPSSFSRLDRPLWPRTVHLRLDPYELIKGSDTFQLRWQLSKFIWTFQLQSELSNFSETFQLKKKLSNFGRFFPTSLGSFQLRWVLSNFAQFFPTSLGSFQLRKALSNFSETFQLQTFQLKTFQLLVLSNCPFQLHVSPPQASSKMSGGFSFENTFFDWTENESLTNKNLCWWIELRSSTKFSLKFDIEEKCCNWLVWFCNILDCVFNWLSLIF